MSLTYPAAASALRLSRSSVLSASISYRATAIRCITSSPHRYAQVQDEVKPGQSSTSTDEAPSSPSPQPQKLGKKARKVLRARQRNDEGRLRNEAKARAKAEAEAQARALEGSTSTSAAGDASTSEAPPAIVKVRHLLQAADGKEEQLVAWRTQARAGDGTNPTAGWSGTLFRSHISSLLNGFGTTPNSPRIQGPALPEPQEQEASPEAKPLSKTQLKKLQPVMSKSERMESQAKIIFRAIREARERGIVDEDESFFYPYPEGVPPKDVDGKDAVWLNLGPDPEAWGKEIPVVKDRWLEVLSLGLTKEISSGPASSSTSLEESGDEMDRDTAYGFDDLVEDYDLEDHERLEQLGDSIVNMSSRLLAYLSYPDVNEGSLTRLSNYPTQNNFLALLFQECGLAARRDELKKELRRARYPAYEESSASEGLGTKEEESAKLPGMIKRDADMFEAYTAAVFLSNGRDFNVVHEWLCHLFRPFQDQAYRFMVQRSEALARLQAQRAAESAATAASISFLKREKEASRTNISADGLGIKSATLDPSSVPFSSLFPDFTWNKSSSPNPIPAYALNSGSIREAFITDEFLTVAARARRQREERLREELRVQDQQELMNMGWFRKGFMNLQKGFRQYVLGKDVVREEEASIRQRLNEQRGMSEKDRQRLRAKQRSAAGISLKSTSSKTKTKINEFGGEETW